MDLIAQLFRPKSFTLFNRETGLSLLTDANVVNVSIKYTSQTLEHRLETGKTKIDARIIKPSRVSIDVIASDADQLEEINNIILDRTGFYRLTTRGLQFDDMKVAPAYISQSPKNISSTPIRLEFVQTLLERREPVIFEFAPDSSVIERGIAMATQAQTGVAEMFGKVTSAASRGYDTASDLFSRIFDR